MFFLQFFDLICIFCDLVSLCKILLSVLEHVEYDYEYTSHYIVLYFLLASL